MKSVGKKIDQKRGNYKNFARKHQIQAKNKLLNFMSDKK